MFNKSEFESESHSIFELQKLVENLEEEHVTRRRLSVWLLVSLLTLHTNVLQCCLSLTNRQHSATVLFDQSLTSSVNLRLGLPRSSMFFQNSVQSGPLNFEKEAGERQSQVAMQH